MERGGKERFEQFAVIVLLIALCVSGAKIRSLERELKELRNNYASDITMLRSEISAIYGTVDDRLKQQESLLSGIEAEYGEIDVHTRTVDVSLKLVPKLLADNMKLRVSINGRSAGLNQEGTTFVGSIPVDLFNLDEQLLLSVETEEGIRNQYLPEIRVDHLWYSNIPTLYHCSVSGRSSLDDGIYSLVGSLDINCSPADNTPDVRFEKFVLVTELNGEELSREDISEAVLNYDAYPQGVYWRGDYELQCEAQSGDHLILRLEATDTLGYVHKMIVYHWKEQNGATAEAVDASEYIYDPSGLPVFP